MIRFFSGFEIKRGRVMVLILEGFDKIKFIGDVEKVVIKNIFCWIRYWLLSC